MITAIVTSDNHLGAFYARLRPERLEQRRRALQQGFERVVDAALERRVDLFLHAGDLFDRPDPRNAERAFVARQVRRLVDAGIPIFAIAGNHDRPRSFGYDGGTMPHEEIEALGAIHLFRNTEELESTTLDVGGTRVCIWGMSSDFNLPDDACPLAGSPARHRRGGDVDLVLLHYGVEGWAPPQAQEPLLSRAGLESLEAEVICVGHLHARQETRLPARPGGGPGAVLLNPGATEHINFGEEHLDCGCWLLHLAPGQAAAEYVPLPAQPMLTIEEDLSDAPPGGGVDDEPGVDPWMRHMLARLDSVSRPDLLLRLRLKGSITHQRFHGLDIPGLQARGAAANFHCQLDTDRLLVCEQDRELPIGYGVSFDVAQELEQTVAALYAGFEDNPAEQEICRLAGDRIRASCER